jgi:hypothetical protein
VVGVLSDEEVESVRAVLRRGRERGG